MHIYYRISDKSYNKPKLIGATKEVCLMNFCTSFHDPIFQSNPPQITILADNCSRSTVKMLMDTGLPIILTAEGNAGSLRKAFDLAVLSLPEDELVYFCEDDYLHAGDCVSLLQEGISIADYVTLYDHPDKYTKIYKFGEESRVVKTKSSHWRFTVSTCMTFAVKVKTLKEDFGIWLKHISGDHPRDHYAFSELRDSGRSLGLCIPGRACHTDLAFSGMMHSVSIEPWAIEMMIKLLSEDLKGRDLAPELLEHIQSKSGWQKLVALDSVRQSEQVSAHK